MIDVDRFLARTLLPPDPILDEVARASAAAGLPPHQVSALQGRFLEIVARMIGARRVLEFGTLGGYSTIWLARSGAHVVTIEADAGHARIAAANLTRAGVADRVTLLVGRALDLLPGMEGPFDLFFLDADKASNVAYLEHALRLARPGSVILADNVVRGGDVVASLDASAEGARRFLEACGRHPGITATAIQTVGEKGHDGFAIAIVRS